MLACLECWGIGAGASSATAGDGCCVACSLRAEILYLWHLRLQTELLAHLQALDSVTCCMLGAALCMGLNAAGCDPCIGCNIKRRLSAEGPPCGLKNFERSRRVLRTQVALVTLVHRDTALIRCIDQMMSTVA